MNNINFFYVGMLLLGVFLSSVSQVMLKSASLKKYDNFIQEYLNFKVIFAYIIFFSTTLLSIYAYKGIPLSLGPVLETTGYIYVTVWGIIIFKEKINKNKVISLILIVLGTVVYSLWG